MQLSPLIPSKTLESRAQLLSGERYSNWEAFAQLVLHTLQILYAPTLVQPYQAAKPASERQAYSYSQMIDITMSVQTNAISSFPITASSAPYLLSSLAGFLMVCPWSQPSQGVGIQSSNRKIHPCGHHSLQAWYAHVDNRRPSVQMLQHTVIDTSPSPVRPSIDSLRIWTICCVGASSEFITDLDLGNCLDANPASLSHNKQVTRQ
jgi:hypothetical protein